MPVSQSHRFIRYAAIGATATVVHYLMLMAAVEWLAWPAWLASGVGAAAGAQVAYAGNFKLTFADQAEVGASWPRFQLVALSGALVGMAVVAALVYAGVFYLLAQMVASLLAMVLTFCLNRAWTFR